MPIRARRSAGFAATSVALAAAAMIAACGGNPSSSSDATESASESETFPTGLAVGSPTDLSASGSGVSAVPWDGVRFARDWARGTWRALRDGDGRRLAHLATAVLPIGSAHAATAMVPEMSVLADRIESVLEGDSSVALEDVLSLQDLFGGTGGDASCYGPSLGYQSHENASGGESPSGTLPSGDLGIWTEYEGGTRPCVAAQLGRRAQSVKGQTVQGLLMMAAMRRTIEASSTLDMPAAGETTDLQAEFADLLAAVPAFVSVNVQAATVSLDADGATYTYRLAIDNGATDATARSGEIIMRHNPGDSATEYGGVMQISAFSLTNDAAMGCTDATDSGTGMMQEARIATVKYSRDGADIAFASRSGNYCGAPAGSSSTDWGADVASFTSDGQLDPDVKLTSPVRGSTNGWRGNFARFAGDFDKDTVAGNFLYAWQAGTGDGNARALAITTDYNSATETRSMEGFFAFAGDIAATDGSLLGMICNWAGPGNSHTPLPQFQSQTASLGPSDLNFVIPAGGSKITYAPTNNCSSTTTEYDVDVSGSIDAGEGAGTAADLDAPTGANSVQQELEARGFVLPTLF